MARDIRVVVSIDFGTTFSGFAYSNKINPETITNDTWPEQTGVFKTNTVLAYDDNLQLVAWGYPALAQEPPKKKNNFKIDHELNLWNCLNYIWLI